MPEKHGRAQRQTRSRAADQRRAATQTGAGDEVRDVVVEILVAIRQASAHASTVMAEFFREGRVPAQRRGVLSEQVYAILRSERLLDHVLDASTKTPLADRARDKGRRLARAVLDRTLTPAEAEREMRRVDWNQVLESRQRATKEKDPVKRLAVSESLPDWLAERMLAQLGEEALPLARALGESAQQTIRTNRIRIERNALADRLREHGIATEETPHASDGLRVVTKTNLFHLAEFREGLFEVQDEGSQLVSELVAPPPGGSVLDACAGTGGKTLHLGALLRGKGTITAVGVGKSAVGQIAELRRRADRAGLNNVRTVLLPGLQTASSVDPYPESDSQSNSEFDSGGDSHSDLRSHSDSHSDAATQSASDSDSHQRSHLHSDSGLHQSHSVSDSHQHSYSHSASESDVHTTSSPSEQSLEHHDTTDAAHAESRSDAPLPPPLQKLLSRVDRVLVDAPCSGVGVLRRNPGARSRLDAESVERLSGLQRSILERFAPFVKVGGRLIYSTCSFLREENEDVVEAFLATHPDFVRMPVKEILGAKRALAMGDGEVLRVFPHRHGTDAFFGVVLRRKGG